MKKETVFFFVFFFLTQAVLSQITVIPLKKYRNDQLQSYSFPFIRSATSKTIAEKINSYLQSQILNNDTIIADTNSIFESSRFIQADSNSQSGYTDMAYEVIVNNFSVLSFIFRMESMGAYPYNFQLYYNFNSHTGAPLSAKDLFTPVGLEAVKKKLMQTRKKLIDNIIQEQHSLNYPFQDSALVSELYAECNRSASEDNFLLGSKRITFFRGPCLPHAIQVYDSDLSVEFTYRQLDSYLSENGKKLVGLLK